MDPNHPKDAEDLTADELAREHWAGQTDGDRAESIRHAALVLEAAKQFEAYLKGESQANRGAPGPHAETDPTCRVMLSFNGDETCTCDGMKSASGRG